MRLDIEIANWLGGNRRVYEDVKAEPYQSIAKYIIDAGYGIEHGEDGIFLRSNDDPEVRFNTNTDDLRLALARAFEAILDVYLDGEVTTTSATGWYGLPGGKA